MNASRWALRFILWFVCILLTQPQNRFAFLFPFHIADIAVMGALGFHVMAIGQERIPVIRPGAASICGVILMGLALISNYTGALQPSGDWNAYIDILFKNVLILLLVEALCTNVARVWAVEATIFFATMWWIKGGLRLSLAGATYAGDRIMGPGVSLVENPNGFAYMLCVMIPLYLYFYQQVSNKYLRYVFLGIALSAVFITLKTGSRTGLICLIVLGGFLLPKYGARHKMTLIISAVVITLLSSSLGALNVERFKGIPAQIQHFLGGEKAVEKPYDAMTQDEQSAWERKMKNKHTWQLILRYPVFGVGMNPSDDMIPGDIGYARGQCHCEILMAGRQMGFVGMGLYAALLIILYRFGSAVQKRCNGWWPEVADLGWTLKLQAIMFVVGGSFSPLPWNIMTLILVACASSLWGLVKNMTPPAPALTS